MMLAGPGVPDRLWDCWRPVRRSVPSTRQICVPVAKASTAARQSYLLKLPVWFENITNEEKLYLRKRQLKEDIRTRYQASAMTLLAEVYDVISFKNKLEATGGHGKSMKDGSISAKDLGSRQVQASSLLGS